MELVVWKKATSNEIVIIDKDEAIRNIAKEMKTGYDVAEGMLLLSNRHAFCLVTDSGFWRYLTTYSCLFITDDDTMEHLFRENNRYTVEYVERLKKMSIKQYTK